MEGEEPAAAAAARRAEDMDADMGAGGMEDGGGGNVGAEVQGAGGEGERAQMVELEQAQAQQELLMQQQLAAAAMQQEATGQQQHHFFDALQADEFRMPNSFEVEIRMTENQVKIVTVDVEKAQRKKAYLGGYGNKRTKLSYHHAFTQTDQTATPHAEKFHREIQTYQYKTKSSKMMREFGTQMERAGLFLDSREERRMIAKPYFSSRMWNERRLEKTLFIQRIVRGWFARMRARKKREQRDSEQRELLAKEEEMRRAEEAKQKEEIKRRLHPRKGQDFETLFNELEVWRLNETKRIKASEDLTEEEKKLALQQLLHKETRILQQIDRLKITATQQNRDEKIRKFLEDMANPKKWKRVDARFTEVHTPFTTRAKELMDLYNGLRLPFLTIDERLDVLLHTKWTVKEFDCSLTREIVDLIDREADMLNRGRSESSLEGR